MEAHLRAVNLKKLDPDPGALNHASESGQAMILDAFSPTDEAPLDHPVEDIGGANLEGDDLVGTEVDPAEHQEESDLLEVGFVDFEMDPNASLDYFALHLCT